MPPQRRQSWQDVVDTQARLAAWLKTAHGRGWLKQSYETERNGMPLRSHEFLADVYRSEPNRVRDADPIFVSAEMCALVDAAMGSFQPEMLMPYDLLTPCGFILYEQPFDVPDRFDRPVTVAGFSWQPCLSTAMSERLGEMFGTVPVTGRQDAAARLLKALGEEDYLNRADDAPGGNGIVLTVYQLAENIEGIPGAPLVVPLHFTPWYFGMSFDGNDVDMHGVKTGAEWWWKILQTTFRLMQQPLSTRYLLRPDKAGRREMQRANLVDRDVIVVRLRREQHPGITDGPRGEANYSHRFIRHGHWRNQHYPSLGPASDPRAHRQIYIADTIVGDDSLPLIIRTDRAFVWTR